MHSQLLKSTSPLSFSWEDEQSPHHSQSHGQGAPRAACSWKDREPNPEMQLAEPLQVKCSEQDRSGSSWVQLESRSLGKFLVMGKVQGRVTNLNVRIRLCPGQCTPQDSPSKGWGHMLYLTCSSWAEVCRVGSLTLLTAASCSSVTHGYTGVSTTDPAHKQQNLTASSTSCLLLLRWKQKHAQTLHMLWEDSDSVCDLYFVNRRMCNEAFKLCSFFDLGWKTVGGTEINWLFYSIPMKCRCQYKHAYIIGMTINFYFSKVDCCFGLGSR